MALHGALDSNWVLQGVKFSNCITTIGVWLYMLSSWGCMLVCRDVHERIVFLSMK